MKKKVTNLDIVHLDGHTSSFKRVDDFEMLGNLISFSYSELGTTRLANFYLDTISGYIYTLGQEELIMMTVGDLKELLKQVKDDKNPVLVDSKGYLFDTNKDSFTVEPVTDANGTIITLIIKEDSK